MTTFLRANMRSFRLNGWGTAELEIGLVVSDEDYWKGMAIKRLTALRG